MDKYLSDKMANGFVWVPDAGVGYLASDGYNYGEGYWAEYVARSKTKVGRQLNTARVLFVRRYFHGKLLDIGIGSGAFVESRNLVGEETYGFDVNPKAVAWLNSRGMYANAYDHQFDAVTFWDSFEHIYGPSALLKNVKRWVFMSIPVFENCDDILASKHYKPNEHIWYFTHHGLHDYMLAHNFSMQTVNRMEINLGREQIYTYAFKRIGAVE